MAAKESQLRWMNAFYLDLSREVEQNLGMLLGKKVRLQEGTCQEVSHEDLLSRFQPPSIFSLIELEGEYSGQGCLAFAKRDAVLLGGLLSMLGEEALAERLEKLDFEESDRDAFQEICNQLIGYADRVLIERLPRKIHLKQKKTVFWEEGDSPYQFEEVSYLLPIHAFVGEQYEVQFVYLFPQSVVAQFTLPTGKDAWPSVRSPGNGGDSARTIVPQVVFISLQTPEKELDNLMEKMGISHQRIDRLSVLAEILHAGRPRLLIFEGNGNLETAFGTVTRLRRLLQKAGIPYWISGSNWTQSLVHRAVELGAQYVLALPLDAERVSRKLREVVLPG